MIDGLFVVTLQAPQREGGTGNRHPPLVWQQVVVTLCKEVVFLTYVLVVVLKGCQNLVKSYKNLWPDLVGIVIWRNLTLFNFVAIEVKVTVKQIVHYVQEALREGNTLGLDRKRKEALTFFRVRHLVDRKAYESKGNLY